MFIGRERQPHTLEKLYRFDRFEFAVIAALSALHGGFNIDSAFPLQFRADPFRQAGSFTHRFPSAFQIVRLSACIPWPERLQAAGSYPLRLLLF